MRHQVCATVIALGCTLALSAQGFKEANLLYNRADYESVLRVTDQDSGDPAVNFLRGRAFYMTGNFKKATDSFEKAIGSSPSDSEYFDWLGRSYGKRAEMSNALFAPSLASKARQAFEKSVQLDPKNRDALDDLFDYYLEAPGFLGGGFEKASTIAERISALDPGEGYYDRFKLDQKRKEFGSAEQHLRQAVAVAPHSVGHMIALAKFLASQGKVTESDALFAKARAAAPNDPLVWFARADVLVKQKRNLDEAKALLTRYMHSPITVDDPPREEARRLLRQAGGA